MTGERASEGRGTRARAGVLAAVAASTLALGVSALAASALVLGAACASPRRGELARGPLTLSGEERRGQVVFARHCHSCHPNGAGGLGPAIVNKPIPAFLLRTQVREGLGSMPAFPEHRLSDADLEAVVKYLEKLRSR